MNTRTHAIGARSGAVTRIVVALALIGLQILQPSVCCADEPVTLVVWMEDTSSLPGLNSTKAFTRKDYDAALDGYRKIHAGPIKSVFVPFGMAEQVEDLVEGVLSPNDRISNLILGTHGWTDLKSNSTQLTELGGFDEKGSFGKLKDLLGRLKTRMSPQLHLHLNACSTACGTKAQFESRVLGLKNELASSGVSRLSVWGAVQPLAFDREHHPQTTKSLLKGIGRTAFGIMVAADLVYTGGVYTLIQSVPLDANVATMTAKLSGAYALALNSLVGFVILSRAWGIGIHGYLTTVGDKIETREIDVTSSDSVFPKCGTFLTAPGIVR